MSETVIFAAGCFWGVQFYLDQVLGVQLTEVGYTGGHASNPSYEAVCSHATGHAEAVRVEFDPEVITFLQLLTHFFRLHDPTQLNGQGPDRGDQYRSAIFYTSEQQKAAAEQLMQELTDAHTYRSPLVTQLQPASQFWPAEAYHQKFAERTGRGVCHVAYEPLPS